MAKERKHYTLLGNAQAYQEEVQTGRGGGGEPEYRDWDESQRILQSTFDDVVRDVDSLPPSDRLDEVVVQVRLAPRYLAKSYHPDDLLQEARLKMRGSAAWRSGPKPTDVGRVLYVSGAPGEIARAAELLRAPSPRTKAIGKDFAKIESVALPLEADRVVGAEIEPAERHAIEVVLFGWDVRRRDEAVRRLTGLFASHGTEPDRILVRPYEGGPTFVAAVVSKRVLPLLGRFNFLRVAAVLPRVEVTRMAFTPSVPAPRGVPGHVLSDSWLAVFDGGVDASIPSIAPFVIPYDLTTKPPDPRLVAHGTAVCSAALYGSIDPSGSLPPPPSRILSFRVLPDDLDDTLELYGVIDGVEAAVPHLPPNSPVVSLSLGPPGPIDDRVSRFTYALDRVAFETGRLIFTAVGNWGARSGGLERIQSPSDAINTLAIGAFGRDPSTGKKSATDYTCRGPGRAGGLVKPDFLAFGGSAVNPFFVLNGPSTIEGSAGTSLATPLAARTAADLLGRCPGLSPLATRAVLLDRVEPGAEPLAEGRGFLDADTESLVACTDRRISVVYDGVLTPRTSYRLPFLLPKGFSCDGITEFSWTIVYLPDVDGAAHDEYSLCGLEVHFRPDARLYDFNPPKWLSAKKRRLRIDADAAEIAILMRQGWSRSRLPCTESHANRTEHHRRAHDAKWETAVRGKRGRRPLGISDPCITVSVISRSLWDLDGSVQAPFAAMLTVSAPRYAGDLYADVLAEYGELRAIAVTPVPVTVPPVPGAE